MPSRKDWKGCRFFRLTTYSVLLAFGLNIFGPLPKTYAQIYPELGLPNPGMMIGHSPAFVPVILRGLKVHPDNPFQFDFIVDTGNEFPPSLTLPTDGGGNSKLKEEATKLIKYFLASLTVPEDDLWVNLSPYEKDRIIPEAFGQTEMGRDLLSQDYILKQLTASLLYPENDLGKTFWDRVYKKAQEQYGTSEIPINTFNKVWIVPDKAEVYETEDTAFVTEAHLKVMLEGDYLALQNNLNKKEIGTDQLDSQDVEQLNDVSSEIVKEVILPEIEREVNEGKNFAQLRQIYNSLILAAWFKRALKENILNKVYTDQNKIAGVDVEDKEVKQKIYQQYLEAFQRGVYDYIKEDYDAATQEIIPRRYFSGGVGFNPGDFGGGIEKALKRHPVRSANPAVLGTMKKVTAVAVGTIFLAKVAFASTTMPLPSPTEILASKPVAEEQLALLPSSSRGRRGGTSQPRRPKDGNVTGGNLFEIRREILENIAALGIMSAAKLKNRSQIHIVSVDEAVNDTSSNIIHVNVLYASPLRDSDQIIENALYDPANGIIQVVSERRDDVSSGLMQGAKEGIAEIISERAHASIIAVIDMDKLHEDDREAIFSQRLYKKNFSKATEVFILNIISPEAIQKILVPREMADAVKDIFLKEKIIFVDSVEKTFLIYRGRFEARITVSVPNYATALKENLGDGTMVIHGIRLPTAEDTDKSAKAHPAASPNATIRLAGEDYQVQGRTLREAIEDLEKKMSKKILTNDGRIPSAFIVSLSGEEIAGEVDLGKSLTEGAVIEILPRVGGGSGLPSWIVANRKPIQKDAKGRSFIFGQAGFRVTDVEADDRYGQMGGWKLHLTVKPENYEPVDQWLFTNHKGQYKLLKGGDPGEKDFTIYVGSKDDADRLSIRLEREIGSFLEESNAGSDDRLFTKKVAGRFDVQATVWGREHDFRYYGLQGLPFDRRAQDEWWMSRYRGGRGSENNSSELKRINEILKQRFGEYFTGIPWYRRGRLPVEQPTDAAALGTETTRSHPAARSEAPGSPVEPVGGIDVRKTEDVLKTKGEGVKFDLPAGNPTQGQWPLSPADLQNLPGLTPVIFQMNVIPIQQLPAMFLGIPATNGEDKKDGDLSMAR